MGVWSDADAASPLPRQRLLSFELPAGRTFDAFVATGNEMAVQHLAQLCAADAAENRQLYLWGAASSGKSHLLQAACRAVTARGGRSAWLPLAELSQRGCEILSGLEALDFVGLDEVDAVATSPDWQHALFDLINKVRACGCRLAMAGRQNPAGAEFQLKDLRSRLMWGAVYRLVLLDDGGKTEVLRGIGERLGCAPMDDVLSYLLSNYPRDLAGLVATVERLAHTAKARKRRVTVPFVKEILAE